MTNAEHRFFVLLAAREESALWEALILPNSCPPTPESYKSGAKTALRELLEEGLIEVFRGHSSSTPMSKEDALVLVATASAFEETEDPPELSITSRGERVLAKDCFGLSREQQFNLLVRDN